MPKSFYDAVGGAKTFDAIVSRFYAQVAEDEVLRRVYPEDDLAGAEERLRMFLEQYWGGPRTYSEQRGHPRLRMRHAPFRISLIERDAWLRCMHTAVASIDSETLDDEHRRELLDYLEMAAHSLVNSRFDGPTPATGSNGPRLSSRQRSSTGARSDGRAVVVASRVLPGLSPIVRRQQRRRGGRPGRVGEPA